MSKDSSASATFGSASIPAWPQSQVDPEHAQLFPVPE
jgi:hypothetical protein